MMGGRQSGKLPGKTVYSGRRRASTRESGYHAHPEATGGELKVVRAETYSLSAGDTLEIKFSIPQALSGQFVGFGGWFQAPTSASCELTTPLCSRSILKHFNAPNWSKFGGMWQSDGASAEASLMITAPRACQIGLWELDTGRIEHKHLVAARKELLTNMHIYSPEAHFFEDSGKGQVDVYVQSKHAVVRETKPVNLSLKSCNRCGRFLPINIADERNHLSFSNHCVANSRRPCKHGGFGRLKDVVTGKVLQLDYGFQLECRYCKKFEVNAAHNPQRSAAQMKEDAQRRRAFEELTTALYGESAQLRYRHVIGRELADDVFERFGGACFKCGTPFRSIREMHLDHTRPLALLWPLDETATALCESCNSEKRDRSPAEFYDQKEIERLAALTGLSVRHLENPHPNTEAVDLLRRKLDWFFNEFLCRPELTRVREGKTAAELLVKALYKVIEKCPLKHRFEFRAEFERRRPK